MSSSKNERDSKIVFAVSPEGTGDGVPAIILGIPTDAWKYMKDGKTHTFDMTKVGLPVKLVLYGAKDHATAMEYINQWMKATTTAYLDERHKDFSIEPKEKP